MNLSEQVIEALQASVKTHWTAIHFYTLLSNQLSRWGYNKLAQEFADDVKEESEHLGKLAQRLEFADVTPAVDLSASVAIPRHDVTAIFNAVLTLETEAATVERAGVVIAREASDEVTADLFKHNLKDSEASIANAEAQLRIISEIGVQNYLANQ